MTELLLDIHIAILYEVMPKYYVCIIVTKTVPGHGNNEVDGVGSVVKNCVRRSVLEGEFVTDATSIHSLVAQ